MSDRPDLEPRILIGDVLEQLATLSDESVHCVVTSPPYWNLRDYGTGAWDGGDPACDHVRPATNMNEGFNERWGNSAGDQKKQEHKSDGQYPHICGLCGAVRVDQQIGLERSPEEYLDRMVDVFREVRRVLRADGTLWLNIGDSYASKARGSDEGWDKSRLTNPGGSQKAQAASLRRTGERHRGKGSGLKEKDLVMIPAELALALRADGWWLRSDIIWAKPNPMPESTRDRPTSAHEHLFLLTKSPRYFYDNEAIREPYTQAVEHSGDYPEGWGSDTALDHSRKGRGPDGRRKTTVVGGDGSEQHRDGERWPNANGRNKRNVWEIATESFSEAHFATFPTKLVDPCILAGTSEQGCCNECGAPQRRILEREFYGNLRTEDNLDGHNDAVVGASRNNFGGQARMETWEPPKTLGWEPSCACPSAINTVPCTVLDPFAGSGTTLLVARRRNRASIGIELNPEYVVLMRKRLERWWERPKATRLEPVDGQLDLLASP